MNSSQLGTFLSGVLVTQVIHMTHVNRYGSDPFQNSRNNGSELYLRASLHILNAIANSVDQTITGVLIPSHGSLKIIDKTMFLSTARDNQIKMN